MSREVVIVGGGRVGRLVADELSAAQFRVTVVELDPARCEQLAGRVGRVVQGDGSDPAILTRADPQAADVVAALTNDTAVNLAVCELVADLGAGARTLLRIARDGEQAQGHRRFVDDVIYPAAAGAAVAVDRITRVGARSSAGSRAD